MHRFAQKPNAKLHDGLDMGGEGEGSITDGFKNVSNLYK